MIDRLGLPHDIFCLVFVYPTQFSYLQGNCLKANVMLTAYQGTYYH